MLKNNEKTIAIIMCTYNRKEKTEQCIKTINNAISKYDSLQYTFYICDDDSSDGTKEMLQSFSDVIIIDSPGNLFWNKCMYLTLERAVVDQPDFFLMINDDVIFFDDMIETMFISYKTIDNTCGIVGTTLAVTTDEITYGGRTEENILIKPSNKLEECKWANWNCFLVDRDVIKRVGLLDKKYEHGYGDYDYSYRMSKKNIPIYVAEKPIGRCDNNTITGTYQDFSLNRIERLKKLFSPKGVPIYSFFKFHLKVYGWYNIIKYIYIYCSIVWYTFFGKQNKLG